MKVNFFKLLLKIFLFSILYLNITHADIIQKIQILGNERISNETIELFSEVSLNQDINENDLNEILKNLYETNFFKDVVVKFDENKLTIKVSENPIIENIKYKGINSNRILEEIQENTLVKSRYSFNEIILKKEKNRLSNILKDLGYYKSLIQIFVEEEKNNLVNLTIDINLGEKAKIKKISFIGNKIFKDSKLKRIIASEEFKFWKFISGKKYLNESLVEFDTRFL